MICTDTYVLLICFFRHYSSSIGLFWYFIGFFCTDTYVFLICRFRHCMSRCWYKHIHIIICIYTIKRRQPHCATPHSMVAFSSLCDCLLFIVHIHIFISKSTHAATLRNVAAWVVFPQMICNTLQHTATHCNTLQHTATHCNTLQHTALLPSLKWFVLISCNALHHTAPHCNTLQHTATHWYPETGAAYGVATISRLLTITSRFCRI